MRKNFSIASSHDEEFNTVDKVQSLTGGASMETEQTQMIAFSGVVHALPSNFSKAMDFCKSGFKHMELGLTDKGLRYIDKSLKLAFVLENIDERDFILCEIAYGYGEILQDTLAIEIAKHVEDRTRAASMIFEPLVQSAMALGQHNRLLRFIYVCENIGCGNLIMQAVKDHYIKLGEYEYLLKLDEIIKSPQK